MHILNSYIYQVKQNRYIPNKFNFLCKSAYILDNLASLFCCVPLFVWHQPYNTSKLFIALQWHFLSSFSKTVQIYNLLFILLTHSVTMEKHRLVHQLTSRQWILVETKCLSIHQVYRRIGHVLNRQSFMYVIPVCIFLPSWLQEKKTKCVFERIITILRK